MKKFSSLKKVYNHRHVYKKMSVNYILWFRRELITVFSSSSAFPSSVFSMVFETHSHKMWMAFYENRFLTMFITFFTFCTMKSRRGKKLFLFYKLLENDLKNTECEEETKFPYGFLFTDFKSMLKRLHNFPETCNIKFKQQTG